ncbi:MAG TPA: RsmE family RNA methyltransferase [Luteibaculaceae bacterium]|nr:RsmE family RNA methyltransferase [Luteibaculaceae bacterium]
MHWFYNPDLDPHRPLLGVDETHHAIHVLRLRAGNQLLITNGKGLICTAEVVDLGKKSVELRGLTYENRPEPSPRFQLIIGPTKNIDRMEWLLEKATEVGVNSFLFCQTERTERAKINLDRLEKVIIAATKQSHRVWKPILTYHASFSEAIESITGPIYIAHCEEQPKRPLPSAYLHGTDATLCIGPEGDFTSAEILLATSRGAIPVSLGEARLRTETAALFALSTLHVVNSL